jgi:hypothetical protein
MGRDRISGGTRCRSIDGREVSGNTFKPARHSAIVTIELGTVKLLTRCAASSTGKAGDSWGRLA